MSISATAGLQAYQSALADFTKAQKQFKATESGITQNQPGLNVSNFSDTLSSSLTEVNSLQAQKSAMVQSFVSGETQNVHELMITMQKASVAVSLTAAVRNKVLEAYKEISKLQF